MDIDWTFVGRIAAGIAALALAAWLFAGCAPTQLQAAIVTLNTAATYGDFAAETLEEQYSGDLEAVVASDLSTDDKLHRAINILQARQFSEPGIMNFLDVATAGLLDSPENAFNMIESLIAKGDYPLLCIANNFSDNAHTVIPFKAERVDPNNLILHIWDSNFPFADNPDHYADTSTACRLTINLAGRLE